MSVAFDAVVTPSGSTTAGSSTSISVPFTAASGATVLVGLNTDRNISAPTSVQYNGSTMTLVDSEQYPTSTGWCFVYALTSGGTGSSANFTATVSTCFWVAAPISFTGVNSVASGAKTNGSSSSLDSGAITLSTGQVAVSFLAAGSQFANSTISGTSGGTNKFLQTNANTSPSLAINYSGTTGVDFTATAPTILWGVVTVKLSPPSGSSFTDSANRSVTFTSTVSAGPRTISDTANRSVTVNRTPAGKVGISRAANSSVAFATSLASIGPLVGLVAKLSSNTNAILQCVGDSTVQGQQDEDSLGGWVGRLGIILGTVFNVNVVMEIYYPSGNYTTTSQTMYTPPGGGGGRATLTVMNGGSPGTTLGNDQTFISSLFPVSAPDVIFLADGFNDIDLAQSNATFTANYVTFVNSIRSTYCATAPIVITAENQTTVTGSITQTNFYSAFSALSTAFIGESLPLSPPLSQMSTTFSNLWFLDTQQAFNGYDLTTLLYGPSPLHPVAAGYLVQASWMAAQLGVIKESGDTANRSVSATTAPLNFNGAHFAGANSTWTVNRPLTVRKPSSAGANTAVTVSRSLGVRRAITDGANRAINYGGGVIFGGVAKTATADRSVTVARSPAGTRSAKSTANRSVAVTPAPVVGATQASANVSATFGRTVAGRVAISRAANRSLAVNLVASTFHFFSDEANQGVVFHPGVTATHAARDGANRLVGINSAVTVAASFRASGGWAGLSGTAVFTPLPAGSGNTVTVQLDGSGNAVVNLPVITGLYLVQFKNLIGPDGAESINPFAFECPEHAIDLNVIAGPAPTPHQWGIAE